MSSFGGTPPFLQRPFFQTLIAAARASTYAAAAGGIEAAVRLRVEPFLYDSRIDALTYTAAAVLLSALAGFLVGLPAALFLAPRWGLIASSFWPVTFGVSAWLLSPLFGGWMGVRLGALAAVILGAMTATGCVALASSLTPPDGLVVGPRERSLRRTLLAPVLLPLAVLGWTSGRILLDRRAPPAGSPSLLLITVDTLRADALETFRDGRIPPPGLEKAQTDRLDALARDAYVFTQASTPLPKTPQAFASIMTGEYPEQHGLTDLFGSLQRGNDTLAEILRRRGWRTRAVVTNMLIGRPSGLSQGFDLFHDKDGLRPQIKRLAVLDLAARLWPPTVGWLLNFSKSLLIGEETAKETTDRALPVLRSVSSAPYFMWVHYLDPHWTYWPPEPYRTQVGYASGSPPAIYGLAQSGKARIGEMIHRNSMSPEERERMRSLYAGEISYVNHEVGRLIDAALKGERGASTLVIFTADHGESLGEHGYYFSHGDLVYEPSMHVPLIVRPPGGVPQRLVSNPVSLVDLVPTALEMLGTSIPSDLAGSSLTRLMSPEASVEGTPTKPVYGESDLSYLSEDPYLTIPGEAGKIRSIRSGWYKLIRIPHDVEEARRIDPTLGAARRSLRTSFGFGEATVLGPSRPDDVALYDLRTDPGELHDLSSEEPRLADALNADLTRWVAGAVRSRSGSREAGKELLDAIRSLGYVDAGGGGP